MTEQFPTTPPAPADSPGAEIAALRDALAARDRDLQAARDREGLLRRELQHRVRNMASIVRSIFSRTMASGASLDDIADHFLGRLDTIARYESFHAVAPGGTVDFEQLVRDELHSFQFGDDPAIGMGGDDVRMGQDVAQLAALAIHELVTNSIKFGTLSGTDPRARLRIRWSIAGAALRFTWSESGVAVLGSAPQRRGFGREFIEQALPYQIGATSSFELRPGGLSCTIEMPLDAVAAPMG